MVQVHVIYLCLDDSGMSGEPFPRVLETVVLCGIGSTLLEGVPYLPNG